MGLEELLEINEVRLFPLGELLSLPLEWFDMLRIIFGGDRTPELLL